MNLVAVRLKELDNIARIDEYSCCIVARMYSHQLVLKILVNENDYILVFVIKDAERCDSSAVADECHAPF